MRYWLCITNEENWNVVKEKHLWGVAERHRNTISKVKNGDKLLMYLKQEKIGDELKDSRISGLFEVQSDVFTSGIKIFKVPKDMKDEIFPLRIKLEPIEIFKQPIDFKPLIPS